MCDEFLLWLDEEILKSEKFALSGGENPYTFSVGISRMIILEEVKSKYTNVPFDGKKYVWDFILKNKTESVKKGDIK